MKLNRVKVFLWSTLFSGTSAQMAHFSMCFYTWYCWFPKGGS